MPDLNTQRINYVSVDDTDLLNRLNVAAFESFADNNLLWDSGLIGVRPLAKGAWSYRYKFRGKFSGDPDHHSPGQFIQGRTRPNAYTDIFIDRPIIEAEDLDTADVDLTNYDEMAASVREVTRTIAELMDKRAFRLGILAARTAAVSNVHNGGNVVERTAATIAAAYPMSATGATNFNDDLGTMARLMDEDNVPMGGRAAIITPWLKQVITYGDKLFSYDYQDPANAKYAERFLGRMQGFALLSSTNHMPSTNVTDDLAKYNGNFTIGASSQRQPVCLCLAGDGEAHAISGVERAPLRTKVYISDDHDAIRVQARIHNGLGKACPWCAGEVGVASS